MAGVPAGCRQLRSHQARFVLAMLVIERGRPVRRDELATLLWGRTPPSSWESVLRTAVARVRAALGEAGVDGRSALRSAAGGYELSLPEGTVVDLERAAAAVEHADGHGDDVLARLQEASEVARRPFLPEADGTWATERRTRQRVLRIRAVAALARARLAAGLVAEAIAAAREVVDLDPFQESAHRLLMSVLASSGNRAQALVAYEKCRTLLADELGVAPSPETEHLFLELLHTEPVPVPAPRDPRAASGPELPARLRLECDGLLVGRPREIQTIRRRIEQGLPGPPGVVLVGGEAGMGKTALVAHAVRDVRALVLYGRCDEDVTLAYRPLVEALTQLAVHLPAGLITDHLSVYGTGLLRLVPELWQQASPIELRAAADPQTERYLLFRAVSALLTRAATERPVAVVLDDLHWADKPSLQLLRYLADAAGPTRLVFVLTYRTTDLPTGGAAAGTVHELSRQPGAERLVLTRLDDDDLVPLVESAAGRRLGDSALVWARAVGRESGGNPFFARELLRHLAERFADCATAGWRVPAGFELPETIREVVGRRVTRLGERTAGVLVRAAVVGQDFDLGTLALVVGIGEDEVLDDLDRAVVAGLLIETPGDGENFAFGHALVQRALYEQVSVTRRRRLHRRVAEAMTRAAVPAGRIGELARHWLLGHRPGEGREAAVWACRAGEHALANLAPDQALVWFREALARLGEQAGDGLHVDVLTGLGEAQRGVGDQGYRETLLTAGRLAESAGDTTRLVRAAIANNRGAVSSSGRLDAERVGLCEAAITAIGERADPMRPLLCATLAVELGDTQPQRRRLLADEAVRGARDLDDPEVLGRVLALRFEATWAPLTYRQRLADSAELLDLAAVSKDRRLHFLAARLRGLACWEAGRTAESDEQLATECRIADEIGEPYLRWVAALSRAGRVLASADHAGAEAAVEAARRLGTAAGEPDTMFAFGMQLLHLRRQQGRADELLPVLRAVETDVDLRPVIALSYAESGALDEARAAAGELLDQPPPPPESLYEVQVLCVVAEVAAALRDSAAASLLRDRLRVCGGLFTLNQVVREGPVDHFLGLLAATAGDLGAADRHFAAAVRAAEEVPLPYWAAESRVAWAHALLRCGRAARARALLASAEEAARYFGFAGTRRKVATVGTAAAT